MLGWRSLRRGLGSGPDRELPNTCRTCLAVTDGQWRLPVLAAILRPCRRMFTAMAFESGVARPFSSFASRVPDEIHRACERRDLYYQVAWPPDGRLPIESRSKVEARSGLTDRESGVSPEDAARELLARRSELFRLAVIRDWRRGTTEQFGSLLGWSALQRLPSRARRRASELPALVTAAWNAGLLARAVYGDLPIVLQPTGDWADHLLRQFSWEDLRALSGGSWEWPGVGGGPRHDLLATELLLRVAEFSTDVAAVGAEASANYGRLITARGGDWSYEASVRWGDGLISRADGQQIVVELTCTAGNPMKLRRKVAQALSLLAKAPGVAVVYIEAGHVERQDSHVWNPLLRAVADELAVLSSEHRDLVCGRIGVARWKHWWPDDHSMADEAVNLTVMCPSGLASDLWQRVDFLDRASLRLAPSDEPVARRRTATAVASSSNPYWLRDEASRSRRP